MTQLSSMLRYVPPSRRSLPSRGRVARASDFVLPSSCLTVRGYHFHTFRESSNGGAPRVGFTRGGSHAQRLETLLRKGRPAFSHLQLLPAAAAVGHRASAQSLCGGPR